MRQHVHLQGKGVEGVTACFKVMLGPAQAKLITQDRARVTCKWCLKFITDQDRQVKHDADRYRAPPERKRRTVHLTEDGIGTLCYKRVGDLNSLASATKEKEKANCHFCLAKVAKREKKIREGS